MERFSLGLRARISFAFAIGGLLVAAILAFTTLFITRQILLEDRDEVSDVIAFSNASQVQNQLTGDLDPGAVLVLIEGLNTTSGSRPLLNTGEGVFSLDVATFSLEDIPIDLIELTDSGVAGKMRTKVQDTPSIIHGIPIQGFDENIVYFEAVPLAEVEDTLATLQIVLFLGSVLAAILAALGGRFVSGQALRPLRSVSDAAGAIAGGKLETRIETGNDQDLEGLKHAFNEMAGTLEERLERDARFASEVSHELRSPLMTLTASVEVLQNSRHELSDRSATALDLLSSDVDRFQTLVDDLLEISRFDVGTAALQADPMLFAEFVEQAVWATEHDAVPVIIDDSAAEAAVVADKRRLARVVTNLLDNARKYGGGATAVHVSATEDKAYMAVEDSGPGVPRDERFVIFDRFSRGGAGGRRGYDTGVGLGLSLVAEHVNLHEGRVWVEERPDGQSGARFVIELPLADLDDHGEFA